MKLNNKITAGGIKIAIILLAVLLMSIHSMAQSQTATSPDYHGIYHPVNQASNAGEKINYVPTINLNGKSSPLMSSINSPYDDIKPSLTPCGKRLYFSRHLHPDNTFGANDLEDIWYSDFDEKTNTWSDPALLIGDLNNAGPNYVNNVSVTGDTIILGNQYKKNGKMRAGLSYSVNVNGQWSFPTTINIKDDYNMSEQANAYVSLKNGVIIKAIERAETHGQRDLYVSFWNGEEATEPINMGGLINTELEEASPFLASDNKTLYFASKGHNGHGGFDIYVTKRLDDTWTNWSEPQNLGPAVNGAMDDEFFSITHCGNYAIFSKQVSVHNTDLYRISMEELFNDPFVKKMKKMTDTKSALAFIAND